VAVLLLWGWVVLLGARGPPLLLQIAAHAPHRADAAPLRRARSPGAGRYAAGTLDPELTWYWRFLDARTTVVRWRLGGRREGLARAAAEMRAGTCTRRAQRDPLEPPLPPHCAA
jgi:hypothetical protein